MRKLASGFPLHFAVDDATHKRAALLAMRAIAAAFLFALAGCHRPERAVQVYGTEDDYLPRSKRYELSGSGDRVFLLDNRSIRRIFWK
jgi:hypothetical protein